MNEATGYYCSKCDKGQDMEDPDDLPRKCPICGTHAIIVMVVHKERRNNADSNNETK